ncbi:hypothetical protein J6590_010177 [Homalodisca vitripennis]|nr:hypothetical protein J6590_010177 [Homalodisca vitripennis]
MTNVLAEAATKDLAAAMANKGRKYGIWKEEGMERAIASSRTVIWALMQLVGCTGCRKKH